MTIGAILMLWMIFVKVLSLFFFCFFSPNPPLSLARTLFETSVKVSEHLDIS